MTKVAIHGFGRIGRIATRVAISRGLFTPIAVSGEQDLPAMAALLKADSNYGLWSEDVKARGNTLSIGGREITYLNASSSIPRWRDLGIDVVLDLTGLTSGRSMAQAHLDAGAKKVLIPTTPRSLQDVDALILPGINFEQYDYAKHNIVAIASPIANALAPVVKVLRENFEVTEGIFSVVQSYTDSLSLIDRPLGNIPGALPGTIRQSWAATENIIPSLSEESGALKMIWPEINITGKTYTVPIRTGSILEFTTLLGRSTTIEEINDTFRKAVDRPPLRSIVGVLEEEWASSRIIGDTHSSLIDLPLTRILNGKMLSISTWYDNEWSYATRLAEMAVAISG